MKKQANLQQIYFEYKKRKYTKKNLLKRFVTVMPEIIFRTTRLEDNLVTKKMVNSLFRQ